MPSTPTSQTTPGVHPEEPNALVKLNAFIGPYPWLAHAAWSGYRKWYKPDKALEKTMKMAEEMRAKGDAPMSMAATRRLLLRTRPLVVAVYALVPEGIFAWLAVRNQRSVAEWERWQQRKMVVVQPAAAASQYDQPYSQASAPAGGFSRATLTEAAVSSSAPVRAAVEAQGPPVVEKGATPSTPPTPPELPPPEESWGQKWERVEAEQGYIAWILSCAAGSMLMDIDTAKEDRANSTVAKKPARGVRGTRAPVAPARGGFWGGFLGTLLVTSPYGVYIWRCKKNVAERDAARVPRIGHGAGEGADGTGAGVVVGGREGEADRDWLLKDTPAEQEDKKWD